MDLREALDDFNERQKVLKDGYIDRDEAHEIVQNGQYKLLSAIAEHLLSTTKE